MDEVLDDSVLPEETLFALVVDDVVNEINETADAEEGISVVETIVVDVIELCTVDDEYGIKVDETIDEFQ